MVQVFVSRYKVECKYHLRGRNSPCTKHGVAMPQTAALRRNPASHHLHQVLQDWCGPPRIHYAAFDFAGQVGVSQRCSGSMAYLFRWLRRNQDIKDVKIR